MLKYTVTQRKFHPLTNSQHMMWILLWMWDEADFFFFSLWVFHFALFPSLSHYLTMNLHGKLCFKHTDLFHHQEKNGNLAVLWTVVKSLPTLGSCMFYSGDPRSQILFSLKINLLTAICGKHVPKSEKYPAIRIICSSHPGKGGLGNTTTLWGRTQSCSERCSILSPVSQTLLLSQHNLNLHSPVNIDKLCIRKSSQIPSASPCVKRKSPPDSWHNQPWYSLHSPKCIASINISHFKELFHVPQTFLSRRPKQKADLAVSGLFGSPLVWPLGGVSEEWANFPCIFSEQV